MTKPRSVRASLGAIVLGFEVIIIFLGSLVLFGLDAFAGMGWPDWSALIVGGIVTTIAIFGLATMRRQVGIALGWLVQALVLAGGILNGMLFIVGAMFGAIWWYAMRAGARIDREQGPHHDPAQS